MIVSTLEIQLLIRQSRSLKDKRRVLKSITTRIKNRFNVSISEIDKQDSLRVAVLGIAFVSNERRFGDRIFQQIITSLRQTPGAELSTFEIDL